MRIILSFFSLAERLVFSNWFNPLLTIYVNLRSFPMTQAWKMPVFVFGWPHLFSLSGNMRCRDGICRPGLVKFNKTNFGSVSIPGPNSAMLNFGTIIFNGKCTITSAVKISVGPRGRLLIGDDVVILHFCNIGCHYQISIGNKCRITHRCQLIDTNFHYIADFNKKRVSRQGSPIVVGDNCWICNTSTITAGGHLPNHAIVASNSLVNKDFSCLSDGALIGGLPAKHISSGHRRIFNEEMAKVIDDFFDSHPDAEFFSLEKLIDCSICDTNSPFV